MVVLEGKGMLTAGNNQYIQPDYLSPLPTTLDSKKSPLALLAQTCSQIGADSGAKPATGAEKKKDDQDRQKDKQTPPVESSGTTRRSPAFKPYESALRKHAEDEDVKVTDKTTPTSSPTTPVAAPAASSVITSSTSTSSTSSRDGKDSESGRRSEGGATPIIRSGLEVLAGHPKDIPLGTYKALGGLPFSLPPGYPSMADHPAYRGMTGLTSPSLSYPGLATTALSPYLTYQRVKTAGGGETVVPVCRDPYCPGCPYSAQNNHLLQSAGTCPPSCTQCEHAKAALSALPPGLLPTPGAVSSSYLPPSSAASVLYSSASMLGGGAAVAAAASRNICNWIVGDGFCGKRFSTAEELLQHLRTHTSASSPSAEAASMAAASSMLSSPLHAASAAHAALLGAHAASPLHRLPSHYAAAPSASSLAAAAAAARYHPYARSPGLSLAPSSLPPSVPGLPPSHHAAAAMAALSAYSSPSVAAAAAAYSSPYASLYGRPPL